MENENLGNLKDKVEDSLQKQIANLEQVKAGLTEDLKSCLPSEIEKNQNLLNAATKLLEEMKLAQINITNLIRSRK